MKLFRNFVILLAAVLVCAVPAFGRSLSKTEARDEAARIWSAWCNEIATDSPYLLPELKPLAQSDTTVWIIPDTLEPNAALMYRYGTKGETTGPMPLFIYLHGSGPSDIEWANGMTLAQRFNDAPCAYFIPKIPNEGPYYRWWQKGKLFAWDKLLRQALASGKIDPDRIYVFGISEGGYGSQRLASFLADYLAAAGPMAGGEPLVNAPVENCRNIGFSLLTGEQDLGFYRNILTYRTSEAFKANQAESPEGDFRHRIELIPNRGHGIDYTPTTPWLSKFTRRTRPARVTWEDYDMDGVRRPGFYNLAIDERPEGSDRMFYDMTVDSAANAVDLKISLVEYRNTETDPNWGISLKQARKFTPATGGKITIFADDELLDLDKPVTVTINGRKAYKGKIDRSSESIERSLDLFGDPRRLYPASVTLSY